MTQEPRLRAVPDPEYLVTDKAAEELAARIAFFRASLMSNGMSGTILEELVRHYGKQMIDAYFAEGKW